MIDMRKREKAVYRACDQLAKDGIEPSVRRLRDIIGGSTDALAQYLRSWRELQPRHTEDDASANSVQIATSNLFDQMINEARGILAADEALRDQRLNEAAVQLEASKAQLQAAAETIRDQVEQGNALKADNDNLKNALAQASEQLAVNRVQLENGGLERSRMTAELAASKETNRALQREHQALHNRLDATRDKAAAKQQDMSETLIAAHDTIDQLRSRLTQEKQHTKELIEAAKQSAEDRQQKMKLIRETEEGIDALQTQVANHEKEASANAKKSALLQQANEHLESRCTQLQNTVEALNIKLENQSRADGLSHAQQMAALTEQLSRLTKRLESANVRKG